LGTRLAWRNLARERTRFVIAIVGVSFAVVLMSLQISLIIGFSRTASGLIRHAGADVWVCGRGIQNVDQMPVVPKRWRDLAAGVPGVAQASPLIVRFAPLRTPVGGTESVMLVGYDLATGLGGPWSVVEGSLAELTNRGIVVDRLYRERIGIGGIGSEVEISGTRAKVSAFTQGIRTFVQSPYIFLPIARSQPMAGLLDDEITGVLLVVDDSSSSAEVAERVKLRIPTADVFTADEFATKTILYWLLSTGVGAYLVLGCSLGILVGVIITAQTLYANAVDHIRSYATMRALGATAGYLRSVIIQQAVMTAVIGIAVGQVISIITVYLLGTGTLALALPAVALLAIAVMSLVMCALSALFAVNKVLGTSATLVFT
jgi:putative ABC transport system permease protein